MDDPNLRLLAGLVGPCPECHNGQLRAVSDGTQTNFLCDACGCCWCPEVDGVNRVNPATCPGCPSRERCRDARRGYWASLVVTGAATLPTEVPLRTWAAPVLDDAPPEPPSR